jgi:hypothetical protein
MGRDAQLVSLQDAVPAFREAMMREAGLENLERWQSALRCQTGERCLDRQCMGMGPKLLHPVQLISTAGGWAEAAGTAKPTLTKL